MKGLLLRLCLEEPVLATGIEGDPNRSVSLPYIPGSAIRGALIALDLLQSGQAELDVTDPVTRRRYFEPATRFLNANPVAELAGRVERALPAPLSWLVPKEENGKVYDFCRAHHSGVDQPRPLGSFAVRHSSTVYKVAKPPVQVNIHTQRDAEYGRAMPGQGAVFRYEALAAGVRLQACILTHDMDDLTHFRNLLEGAAILMGGARTSGYGRVQVEEVNDLSDDWDEAGEPLDDGISYDRLVVRCLSDIILRDEYGNASLDLVSELNRRLEHRCQVANRNGEAVIYRRSQLVGGFNRKWNLPLPQDVAIAAGSVFLVELKEPVSGKKLKALAEGGLGERQVEGFGRVTFEDPEEPGPILTMANFRAPNRECRLKDRAPSLEVRPEQVEQALQGLSGEERAFAEQFLRRVMRQALDEKLKVVVNKIRIGQGRRPSNSQLGRWRVMIRSALAAGQDDRLLLLLANEKAKNTPAWQAFERTRLELEKGRPRLSEWIEDVLHHQNSPWVWLTDAPQISLGNQEHQLVVKARAEEAFEYRLKLLDGVLDKIARISTGEA